MSAMSFATLFESGYTRLLSLCGCSWVKRFRPIIPVKKRSIGSTPGMSRVGRKKSIPIQRLVVLRGSVCLRVSCESSPSVVAKSANNTPQADGVGRGAM
jgi:hypothetical protein